MSHNGQVMENFVTEACQEMISILIAEIGKYLRELDFKEL